MMNQMIQTFGQNMIRYIGGGRGHQRIKYQAPYTLQGNAYHTHFSKLFFLIKIQKSGIFKISFLNSGQLSNQIDQIWQEIDQ